MCGICGIFRRDSVGPEEHHAVDGMVPLMRHRGPDGVACWSDRSVVFGHARLAIIDIDGGRQPMVSADEAIALVFNGEIYNYRELKAELTSLGARFSTNSDTEVVLVGYRQWGVEVFSRLNGMFAVGIWDAARSELVLARDRFGEKPLYIHERADGRVAFASEIKVLFADPTVPRRANSAAFTEYLAFRAVGGGRTLFEGIEELPAATIRRYTRDGRRERVFWTPQVPIVESTAGAAASDVDALLYAATERRLVSDVPVGSIVSGGLDSSLVTAMAIRAAGQPLDTFCVGFEDPRLDERPYARAMADHVGARHHELVVRDEDFAESVAPLTWAHDAPLTHPNAVPMHLVFQFARETAGVKVVLSGEGADELFGGYAWYSSVARRPRAVNAALLDALAQVLPPVGPLRTARRVFRSDYALEANAVTSLAALEGLGLSTRAVRANRRAMFPTDRSEIDGLYLFDQRTYLPPLLQRQDRMSMAAGVEARVVFLDHLLAERVNSLPDTIKRPNGIRKGLLRRTAERWLPMQQLVRPKVGFVLPLARWLSPGGGLYELRDHLRGSGSLASSIFDQRTLGSIVDRDVSADPAAADLLWSLVALEVWGSIFLGAQQKEFLLPGASRADAQLGASAGALHLA